MAVDKNKMAEKGKGLWGEFKEFISRGSVMDLAVGMIIGAAFTAIVTSLVNDIVMPLIGVIIGGLDFSMIKSTFMNPLTGSEVSIMWGNFISAVVNFLIISLVIFLMVKAVNTAHDKFKHEEAAAEAEETPAEPSDEAKLLAEIRDYLLNRE